MRGHERQRSVQTSASCPQGSLLARPCRVCAGRVALHGLGGGHRQGFVECHADRLAGGDRLGDQVAAVWSRPGFRQGVDQAGVLDDARSELGERLAVGRLRA